MSTFADFALLAAVPSYGGAEILRAQRIIPMGPGPRVHLAVLGRNDSVVRRLVASAHAGSAVLHPSFARIFEVCRFDGVAYAVADPSEGLDIAAVLSAGAFPFELALAVTSTIGRVAVAVHDAAGGRGQVGFASVISGGLSPDVVFLEPAGAVRIRPVAAAGLDPEEPTAYRAPEEAITMAADVYSLGRLLMALLSGDARGLTMPRLSPSSPLPPLIARMVARRPNERPHLHEAVTRIEQVLNGRQAGSADQVVRNALAGAFRQLVVDPGLGLEAPPHAMHELRMRLPYVYAATERIWPTMNPGFAPPPAVFAALPASSPQALLGSGDDDDADVFSDKPAPRRRARTAATMRIDADELAAAVPAVDANAPHQPAPTRRFRPTKKTVLIAAGEMIEEMERQAPASDATAMLDVGELEPFAADVPSARAAPVPRSHDVDDDEEDDGAFSSSFSRPPARSAPVPPPRTSSPPPVRPPRPPTHAAMAVFGSAGDAPADDDAWDDDEPLFAPAAATPVAATAIARVSPPRSSLADADRAALLAALADDDDIDASAEDDDEGAFSSSTLVAPPPALVAPPPALSEPGPRPVQRPSANTFTPPPPPAAVRAPPVVVDSDGDVDFAAAFAAAFAGEPSARHADDEPVELDLEEIEEVEPLEDDAIEPLDDAAAFVMVGEAGTAFPPDGPLSRSTRMYPAQAMQVAVDDDSSVDQSAVDESAVDDSVDQSADDSSDDEFSPATQRAFDPRELDLDLDVAAAFDAAAGPGSPWAPAASATGPGAVESPRTEMLDAVNWQAWSNEGSNGATRPMMPVVPAFSVDEKAAEPLPRFPTPSSSSRAFAPTMPAMPVMPSIPARAPAIASPLPAPPALHAPPTLPAPPPTLPAPPPTLHAPPATLHAPPSMSAIPALSVAPSMPEVWGASSRPAPFEASSSSARRAPPPVEASSSVRRPPPPIALPESPSSATMLSPLPELPDLDPATTLGADVFEPSVPRGITGLYDPPPTAPAAPAAPSSAELVVEAPAGATVALNGTPIGTVPDAGRLSVGVAGDARVVVRVTLAGCAPWSSVVSVLGRPRVRVKAVLAARP